MGDVNAAVRAYFENNAVLAALVNAGIYQGKPVVRPEDVSPADTWMLLS